MKKIKSIKQLQAEKRRMHEQLDFLENKMHNQWRELKYSLRPAGMLKEGFSSILKSKTEGAFNGENMIKGTLALGVSILINRLARKAAKKFSNMFKEKGKQQETGD